MEKGTIMPKGYFNGMGAINEKFIPSGRRAYRMPCR